MPDHVTEWFQNNWKRVAMGVGAVAAIAVAYFCFFGGKAPEAKPEAQDPTKKVISKEEQTQEIRDALERIANCEAFVRSTGNHKDAVDEIQRARSYLDEYREKAEEHKLSWMDSSLRSAYDAARRPATIAELYRLIDETSAFVEVQVKDRDVAGMLWVHTRQATTYVQRFASGAGDKYVVLVRAELDYVRSVANKDTVIKADHPMIRALNSVVKAERLADEWGNKKNVRLVCHSKQARRFFNAAVQRYRPNDLAERMAIAEAEYAIKIAEQPDFTVEAPKDEEVAKKDDTTVWLKLVDRFAAQIQRFEKEAPHSEKVEKSLVEVRKTYDWVLNQIVNGQLGYRDDHFWVKQQLDEVDREFRRIEEARTIEKLEKPYDAEFQTWYAQYLKDNPTSWVKDQKVEIYLVNSVNATQEAIKNVIKNREHCYLKTTFNGRSVLVVVEK